MTGLVNTLSIILHSMLHLSKKEQPDVDDHQVQVVIDLADTCNIHLFSTTIQKSTCYWKIVNSHVLDALPANISDPSRKISS